MIDRRNGSGIGRRKALVLMLSTGLAALAAPQALLAGERESGFFGNWFGAPQAQKVAPTTTEIVKDLRVRPMLDGESERLMLDAIARYEIIVARGGWPELPMPGKALKRGSADPLVPYLRIRLAAEGYLPFQPVQNDDRYDQAVEQAVRNYQTHHGLFPHGKLDGETVRSLNVSAAARLETLRANLPRVQEYARDLGDRYIVVNIPAAQLESVEYGIVYSRHNIIAGMTDRPSPTVASRVTELNFNPYWNAPASIVEKDIIPLFLKDPNALDRLNIKVYDGLNGPEVDPRTIDWSVTPPDRYHFRQEPGEQNAMASVKINFPNPYSVFMHDTPTPEKFAETERYFSSGCVRVEKVHMLTDWILAGQDGWDLSRIQAVAKSGERLDVPVANPPQLRWVYLTAWVGGDGHVNFRPDIYNLDGTGFVTGQPVGVPPATAG